MTDTAKLDGKFAAKEQQQLAEVRRQLAEVDAELESLSRAVPQAALRQALGQAPFPGDDDVLRRQQACEARLHLLRQAEHAALRAEEDRKAAATYASDAARHRALIQKLAAMHKAAMRFSAAATNANAALVDLLAAGRAAFALMPPHLQRNHSGPVSPSYLARVCRAELGRLDSHNPLDARLFRHAMWVEDLRRGNTWITLPDLVQGHVDGIKRMAGKLAVPDPNAGGAVAEPVHPAEAPPATETPPTENTAPSEPPAPRKPVPQLDLTVDLRGRDLGVPKLTPDIVEPVP